MTQKEFTKLFKQHLRVISSREEAYDRAEQDCIRLTGDRMFTSFTSFNASRYHTARRRDTPRLSQGIWIIIAMILGLGSCSIADEPGIDTPGFVTYTITGDQISLQIHSDQPSTIITHRVGEWSQDLIIDDHYYSCISLAIDPASEIEITDGIYHAYIHSP